MQGVPTNTFCNETVDGIVDNSAKARCGSRETTFKEFLQLKIKQHQEAIDGLHALIRNLPTELNERDDRAIRNTLLKHLS